MSPEDSIFAEILLIGDNKILVHRLREQILSRRGLIPFVGAGMSVPYRLPEWDGLLKSLAISDEDSANVQAFLKLTTPDYESAAEYLLQLRGPSRFQLLFRSAFDATVDTETRTPLTYLMDFPPGPIVTTNFDRVLETVFEAAKVPLKVIVGNRPDETSEALQFYTGALLKIHGDIGESAGRILAASEYEKHYSLWLTTILRNLATQPLLFLGYSLRTDRPAKILQELVREGQVLARHYAVLPLPETSKELAERNRFLSEQLHVDAIWYPSKDRHRALSALLEWLTKQVPEKLRRRSFDRKGPLHLQLPVTRFNLYGRDEQMRALLQALETAAVVTIEGSRGAGKTAFSLDALRQLQTRQVFGALVYVTAAYQKEQLRLAVLLQQISKTIDFPYAPLEPTEQQEQRLSSDLEAKGIRCLVVADNYETVSDEQITAFLLKRRPVNITVLIVSSRRMIEEADYRVVLDELSEPDTSVMFRSWLAREGIPSPSDAEVRRLYEVVGGNPQAIEWTVGRMSEHNELPSLLDSLAKGNAEILASVFEDSWNHLVPDARTVLSGMTVFALAAPDDALRAVSGMAAAFPAAVSTLKTRYLLKSLRVQDSDNSGIRNARKYFIHPFTRDYLESRRDSQLSASMFARAGAFYLNYVRARGGTPDREEVVDQYELNDQRENMLGVLQGCVTYGEPAMCVDLVQEMARWLFIESHWTDLRQWGKTAVELALLASRYHAAARILNETARVDSYQSRFGSANEGFEQAFKWASVPPPDEYALAYIRHHMGEARMRRGRTFFGEARELLEDSLNRFKLLRSARDIIGVRYRLAMLAFADARNEEARQLASEGITDCRDERWNRLEGFHHRLLGDIAVREGDLLEARFEYEETLKLVPRTDMRIQALIELSLAHLEHREAHASAAEDRAASAQAHFEKIGMHAEAKEAAKLLLSIKATSKREY